MNHFLLVGRKEGCLGRYADLLRSHQAITITQVESGQQALDLISDPAFDLVMIDEKLDDFTGLALVEMVVKANPMVLCSVVSTLSADDFHESSEGLGVLCQLSPRPTKQEVDHLLIRVNNISNLTV